MKFTIAAASALLLGTSALALAPAKTVDGAWHDTGSKTAETASFVPKPQFEPKPVKLLAFESVDDEPDGLFDSGFKPVPASAWLSDEAADDDVVDAAPTLGKADVTYGEWAADDAKLAVDKDDEAYEAALDEQEAQASEDEIAAEPLADDLGPVHQGVGGPEELVAGAVTAADLVPRPATRNYPPCDPGPGDDNCIQLYEPGVRMALASWNGDTGGLMDHSATTAMGGPYEPVDEARIETADASDVEARTEPMPDDFAGTGGPVVETGYPPCSGSPSDDRCIQLYEPGVTGAGN